jgi:hypothetical protein
MASTFNAKTIHKDGKTELRIGLDDNSKILEGNKDELIIKNPDGSDAKIAKENIVGMPNDVSEENKLVTQKDLEAMLDEIKNITTSAQNLSNILNGKRGK